MRNFICVLLVIVTSTAVRQTASANPCPPVTIANTIELCGPAHVIDGDTLWVGIHKIRLFGIEALEHDQTCKDKQNDTFFDCVEKTKSTLKSWIEGKSLRCTINKTRAGRPKMDRNRYLGICYLGDEDLNRKIVSAGWALAVDVKGHDGYAQAETAAQLKSLGIHQTRFLRPNKWRKRQRDARKCSGDQTKCMPNATQNVPPR